MSIVSLANHLTEKRTLAFWARIDVRGADECWLWMRDSQLTQHGYGAAFYGPIHTTAHRIAWMIDRGDIPPGHLVMHKCDTRRCCNPSHLLLGSPQDNMDDMRTKGREDYPGGPTGEQNGNAKLRDRDVKRIRLLSIGLHLSQRELARLYGVSKSQIGNIIRGESRNK